MMIIKTLVENFSVSKEFGSEHGLSLYIETKNDKILFDVGATNLFSKNARKMNVNIAEIDYLIISHGHYDHGGGLDAFLLANSKATIYINEKAFDEYFAKRDGGKIEYIGLDRRLKENPRIRLIKDNIAITPTVKILTNIIKKVPLPKANEGLLAKVGDELVADQFLHEQVVVIVKGDQSILLTGCAHSGIANILEHYFKATNYYPNYVFGGFHLAGRCPNNLEDPAAIQNLAKYLLNTGAQFYTCHCTGLEAYEDLRHIMGEKIVYLKTGSMIEIK